MSLYAAYTGICPEDDPDPWDDPEYRAAKVREAYADDERPWGICRSCFYERPIGIPCGEPCV